MESPPAPPLPSFSVAAAAVASPVVPTTIQLNNSDSIESSSPRSNAAVNTFNEPLLPVPGAKLRLMCSYGGHIIPRPHDKNLCYVGGETRIVVVDRQSCLSALTACLSRTLLNGRPFTLKYQLPSDDLDSLVSVTTDEDLENMIEEYDRVTMSSLSTPSRIRLFLFCNRPESAASMGSLLHDSRSESWYVDALNDSAFPRNLSDSAIMDCLPSLENANQDTKTQVDGAEAAEEACKQSEMVTAHEIPDPPSLENGSYTPPSMANLPPIRVRVADKRVGIQEQFARLKIQHIVQKQYDANAAPAGSAAAPNIRPTPSEGSGGYVNRISPDDERSVNFCRPPLPLQTNQKAGTKYYLSSPDSIASDISVLSANSFSKPVNQQEEAHDRPRDSRTPDSQDAVSEISIASSQSQQVQESAFVLPQPQIDHQQQQQFLQAGTHFIHHPSPNPVPISTTYYPVYGAPPPPQHQIDYQQHPPAYVMPIPQAYTSSIAAASSHMLQNPAPSLAAPAAAPSVPTLNTYPANTSPAATSVQPELAATMYRTAVAVVPNPRMVPVPAANQFQQQYNVAYSQMQYVAPQSIPVAPSATPPTYGYELTNAAAPQDHAYYSHATTATAAAPFALPQYQSMIPAPTAIPLADASTNNMTQQIGDSQAG